MSAAPWPCWRCGAPGARNIGTLGYCGTHLTELLDRFDPAVWQASGVGLPRGRYRPEYGPDQADLTCIACGAGWVGVPGERCEWCARHRDLMREAQRDRLLELPEVEPDDRAADERVRAWGERLRRAVAAGIITRNEARTAWRRAVAVLEAERKRRAVQHVPAA